MGLWMMRSSTQMKSSRSLSMREKLRCPKVMVPTQTFPPCHLWVMGIQEGCLPRATLLRPTCILPTLRLPTLPSRWGGFPHSKQESLRWVVCLPRDTLLIRTLLLDPPCQGLIAMEFLCMGLFQVVLTYICFISKHGNFFLFFLCFLDQHRLRPAG